MVCWTDERRRSDGKRSRKRTEKENLTERFSLFLSLYRCSLLIAPFSIALFYLCVLSHTSSDRNGTRNENAKEYALDVLLLPLSLCLSPSVSLSLLS